MLLNFIHEYLEYLLNSVLRDKHNALLIISSFFRFVFKLGKPHIAMQRTPFLIKRKRIKELSFRSENKRIWKGNMSDGFQNLIIRK
jgi:hypothetical protein